MLSFGKHGFIYALSHTFAGPWDMEMTLSQAGRGITGH